MSAQLEPIEVFLSYADADEALCRELEKHLSTLQYRGLIHAFHKQKIVAGADRAKTIHTHLETASLILLLVSSDFLASEYYYGMEMKRSLERHQANEAQVIPILLRPADWQGAPFEHLPMLPTGARPITTWENPDAAFADIVAGIRQVIEERSPLPLHVPARAFPAVWNIPYPRNTFFTGREHILAQLADALKASRVTALVQPQAIIGLGGIGKTQTAVEYAYRHRQEYSAVLWVKAHSYDTLITGFVKIAEILGLPLKDEQDQQRIIQGVKSWFNGHANWLLIFDDVEDIPLLGDFLPQNEYGHVMITTRSQSLGTIASMLEIEKMPVNEAVLFLLRRAKRIRRDDPLEAAAQDEQERAGEIATLLDGLPLALDQAGAYVEETRSSLTRYLELYKQRRSDLLKKRGRNSSGHPESVTMTFLLCFEKVAQIHEVAAELLRCCALLHPDDIPEEIFTAGAVELGSVLRSLATNPLVLDEAMAELFRYSLLQRDVEVGTVTIHRLVQAVLLDEMGEQVQQMWAEKVVNAIMKVFPDRQPKTWSYLQRYLAHVQVCTALMKRWNMQDLALAKWLFHVGEYVSSSGFYTIAEQLYTQGNALFKEDLSKMVGTLLGEAAANYAKHSPAMEPLISISPLPLHYFRQGRYDEAETHFKRMIRLVEQFYGPEHERLVDPLNGLGMLYLTRGKYADAERLFQRALNIHLHAPSVDADELISCLNNIAELYRKQEMYEQAAPLYQQALRMSEAQFGPDHIEVAHILHNMALLCRAQKNYVQAEALYLRALPIYERTHGPGSPLLANVLNSLGALYCYRDEDAKAEPLLLRALAIREEILGRNHADVGRTLNNLGALYMHQEKHNEAQTALQRALQIYANSFGEDHPEVAMILGNLGELYSTLHKYEEAEKALEKALMIYEKTGGLQSPNTIAIFQELILVYGAQKKALPAQILCQRMLPALKARFGPDHKHVRAIQDLSDFLSPKIQNARATVQKYHKSPPRSKGKKNRRSRK